MERSQRGGALRNEANLGARGGAEPGRRNEANLNGAVGGIEDFYHVHDSLVLAVHSDARPEL
jgi:hypothetical protein